MLEQALDLVGRAHRSIPQHFRGATILFWVFQVLRDYSNTLHEGNSRYLSLLPELLLEAVSYTHLDVYKRQPPPS